MTENRKHPRAAIEADVAFQVGDGPRIAARCRDVSLGGMFIETQEPSQYGLPVRVYMHLPDLKAEVCLEATVRWAKPTGMGVQFASMGARETHGLTELLHAHPTK